MAKIAHKGACPLCNEPKSFVIYFDYGCFCYACRFNSIDGKQTPRKKKVNSPKQVVDVVVTKQPPFTCYDDVPF